MSWDYPKDRILALQHQAQAVSAAVSVDTGLSLEKIRFRYAVSGSKPSWKPLCAFDDGEKVYIQFPPGIAQGELPRLFVIGAPGYGQLVNYCLRSPYYIVDRQFGATELCLRADVVAATAAALCGRADRALQRRSRVEVRRAGCAAGGLLEVAAAIAALAQSQGQLGKEAWLNVGTVPVGALGVIKVADEVVMGTKIKGRLAPTLLALLRGRWSGSTNGCRCDYRSLAGECKECRELSPWFGKGLDRHCIYGPGNSPRDHGHTWRHC